MDPHALFTDELLKRAVQQQIAQEDAQPKAVTLPPESPGPGKSGLLALIGGGAADLATTVAGLKTGQMRENNSLIRGLDPKIGLPLGAAAEMGTYLLARKLLADKHPKLLNALSMAAGAAHGGLAVKNVLGTRAATRETPPRPNLVKQADGSWIDPSAFQ